MKAWAGRGAWSSSVAGLMLLTTGCGWFGGQAKPDWVTGNSWAYPQDQYITGLGEAESVSSATERAYAAVAKVFKAEISSEAREWESYLLVESRGKSQDERRLTLDHVTNVTTDKVIENVAVLDKWYDSSNRRYAVLAGISRRQGELATLNHLTDLDQTISAEVTEARQAQETLARLRQLKRAIKSLVLREAYNADLRVLRLSGQGITPPYRVAELTAELERLVATVPIEVELTGDHREPIGRAVTQGLIQEGLTVVGAGSVRPDRLSPSGFTPALSLRGQVQISPIEVQDPQFRYVRWCSDFVLVDRASQRVVGALSRGDKVGHVSVQEATARALRAIQQEFSGELAKTVAAYVYGDLDATAAAAASGACPREGDGMKPSR